LFQARKFVFKGKLLTLLSELPVSRVPFSWIELADKLAQSRGFFFVIRSNVRRWPDPQ